MTRSNLVKGTKNISQKEFHKKVEDEYNMLYYDTDNI